NNEIIQGLTKLRIEKLKETDNQLKEKIDFLFNNLQLVAENKPPLVTFSKTMHFFLPNLFMPIDRKFTLPFFYRKAPFNPKNHVPFSKDHQSQIQIFCDIFEQFRQFANKHRSSLETQINPNSRWNRNIPKIIDNIIIAYVINNTIK
ncbi:MAG: hypothetical protein LBF88_08290, partial [Planctomycetaceae bacterium]|nr:hypothetical protein [Planctomycetaceae bacterium]